MTRPTDYDYTSPRLLTDYAVASTSLASPARMRMRRSTSPTSLTAGLTSAMVSMCEKALSAMGRCTSPDPVEDVGCLPIETLPPHVAERILGFLSADDLCAAALCCRFLLSCIPNAAVLAAERIGFELEPPELPLNPSSTCGLIRQLHTFECQAWLAGRTMQKLSSEDRPTRLRAILRCASLPLPAIAHHDVKLLRLTTASHVEVRLRALRTLSQFSPRHTDRLLNRDHTAVDAVLARLDDKDDLVRRAALAVLQSWIEPGTILSPRIARALHSRCMDSNEVVCAAAQRLLEAHEADGEDEYYEMTDVDDDEELSEVPMC